MPGRLTGFRIGVFSSADGGETWTDTGLPFGTAVVSLAVSQSVIYAGTSNGVFKNAGGSWTQASADIHEAVVSVAADPSHPDVVYAGTNSALFYTTSGGATWSMTLPYPIYSVVVAPSNPSIVYVATWYGSGMTEDGGLSAPIWGIDWQATGPAGTNLFVFAIDPLDARASTEAATSGGTRSCRASARMDRTWSTRPSSAERAPNGRVTLRSIPAAPPMWRGRRNRLTFPCSIRSSLAQAA